MNDKSVGKEQLEALRELPHAPSVFISYSHDSAEHKNWVLRLATQLRKNGLDAVLDVWDLKPGDDVAKFMEHLTTVDRVVIVCSECYASKAAEGKGGVGYETMLVTAEILQNRGVIKFIPIMRNNPKKALPPFLRTRVWIDFEQDADYSKSVEQLTRAIHEAPANPKPPLGQNPFLSVGSTSRDFFADEWFAKHKSAAMSEVQRRGAFMEVAFGASTNTFRSEHRVLLNVAERSAIHTFGWPIGVVLHRDDAKPKPDSDGIVAKIACHFSACESFDYWALRLNGDFYLAENLFENERNPNAIFFNTRMIRVAESLLYCRSLYNNLGVENGTVVQFLIRHSGIKGRILSTSNPNRMWFEDRKSSEDSSEVSVNFEHPLTDRGVVEKTTELLNPLFVLFDFFEPSESLYQDVVGNFIQGRCT